MPDFQYFVEVTNCYNETYYLSAYSLEDAEKIAAHEADRDSVMGVRIIKNRRAVQLTS